MRYSLILLAVAGLAVGASGAAAQNCNAGNTMCQVGFSATIPQVLYITTNAGAAFNFNNATDADFQAGYMQSLVAGRPVLTTRGNVDYDVNVRADALMNGAVAADASIVPSVSTDLFAAQDLALTTSDQLLFSHARGGNVATNVDARMSLNYANGVAGTYTTTVYFTIVAS